MPPVQIIILTTWR